jgi:hypothetical protein
MMRCNRRSGKDGRLITLAATKPIRLVNSYEASKSRIGRGDLDWACAAVWFKKINIDIVVNAPQHCLALA